LDREGETGSLGDWLRDLAVKSTLADYDIRALRQALDQQGVIDRRLAAEIFHTNRVMRGQHDGWTELYLDILTGFFLSSHQDQYELPGEKEALLLAWLGEGSSIVNPAERRLALRLLMKTANCPLRLEQRVLNALAENLLEQSERWLGIGERSAGLIDALDMQTIRRLLEGGGGSDRRQISRAAATFLLRLQGEATRFADPESWQDLLITSLARHVIDRVNAEQAADASRGTACNAILEALLIPHQTKPWAAQLRHEILMAAQSTANFDDDIATA